ncbi:LarC family nickel insertion protein [Benzoatithermus flavus]|uniref:LarC family nickel insertion protein n=1 Tax=Benzoatithermus flavus TaxID=3108223 RepID=A0ABU8XX78_9PROT
MAEPVPRHIHLDAVGGIAGDMFVAAMLDALPELTAPVMAELDRILPVALPRPRLETGTSGGIRVRRLRWEKDQGAAVPTGAWPDLARLIGAVGLAPATVRHALAILEVIAAAEAEVHGVPLEEVHFHELADWDSVLDVVAAGSIVGRLEGAVWSVSDLPLGSGTVATRHGRLPVPAPATLAILEGFAWRDDGIGGERVTPTGAAILRHLVPGGSPMRRPTGRLVATGLGAGTRELPGLPNLLRALVLAPAGAGSDVVAVLEFEVDDMTGEEIGMALDGLRAVGGVLDASVGSRFGKKGRPLHGFRVLVRPEAVDAALAACFAETTTLGVRRRLEVRAVLARRTADVALEDATLRVKLADRPDGSTTAKAESDDAGGLPGLAARRRRRAEAERRALGMEES